MLAMRGLIRSLIAHNLPSRQEIVSVLITGLIGGFIFANSVYALEGGLVTQLRFTLAILVLLVIIEVSKRLWATYKGYRQEFRIWWIGLLISLLVALYSRGFIAFLLPGGYGLKEYQHSRFGGFPDHMPLRDIATVGLAGIVGGVVWIVLTAGLVPQGHTIAMMTVVVAMLVPLDIVFAPLTRKSKTFSTPPTAASALLWSSRTRYVFTVVMVVTSFILVALLPWYWTLPAALLIGAIGSFLYYWYADFD